ncbi:MAG: UbiA family prenyltransferase [Thermodesulfobacteriota bacterium]
MAGVGALVRLGAWWPYKGPHILSLAYIACAASGACFGPAWPRLGLFALWILGTAGAAYVINDICDERADRAAGKIRAAAALSGPGRAALLLLLAALSLFPWAFLHPGRATAILVLLEYTLLVAYSARPFRLKVRTWAGPAADAAAGHLLPAIIAFLAFGWEAGTESMAPAVLPVLCLWQAAKGFRNILVHQLEDRKADRKAGAATLVIRRGPLFAVNLINRVLLPAELFFLALFCVLLEPVSPAFALGLVCFGLVSGLGMSIWKLFFIPRRQFRIKFWYFANDFYEVWLPLLALAVLTGRSAAWGLLVLAHLLLFPAWLAYGKRTMRAVAGNIREEARNPTKPLARGRRER